MGNEASTYQEGEEDYPEEYAKFDGIETLGYRVLGVQPNSPASTAVLVSFLDFLVGVNGEMLMGSGEGLKEGDEYDDIDFHDLLKENNGKQLELLVHNIKSNSQRLVNITPSSEWGRWITRCYHPTRQLRRCGLTAHSSIIGRTQ